MLLDKFHQILKEKKLGSVFQPIVDLRTGQFVGYEGLIRVLDHPGVFDPVTLFQTARQLGRLRELEELCCRLHVLGFVQQGLKGRLFLNSSPDVIVMLFSDIQDQTNTSLDYCPHLSGLDPKRLVLELTETERADSYHQLSQAMARLRRSGLQFAIDDLGEGYSCLRLWSELQPEYVKIDRYFVSNIDSDVLKQQLVRSVCDIAERTGSTVIAEGIERAAELHTLQELGVTCGQGYFLAEPAAQAIHSVHPDIRPLFRAARTISKPRSLLLPKPMLSVAQLLQVAPALDYTAPIQQVYEVFVQQARCRQLVVVRAGVPLGIVRREQLGPDLDLRALPAVDAQQPCTSLIEAPALVVDIDTELLDMGEILAQAPERHMLEGFIITDSGVYAGVGSSAALMQAVCQLQVRTARHANPLTQLPTNVPLNEHLEDLLRQGEACVVCSANLGFFQPYNAIYGYRKGDHVLQVVAALLQRHVCPEVDFIGHLGSDDFMIVFRSADWRERCDQVLAAVPQVLGHLYWPEHLKAGGYVANNRQGTQMFHPLIQLSLGAVVVERGASYTATHLADLAWQASAQAKQLEGNALYIAQRQLA